MVQKEIEASIVLARQFPRDEDHGLQKIVRACRRPAFAEKVEYRFPRAGKTVHGGSIYFARECARVWGNIQFGFSIVDDSETHRTVRGWAWDLENNSRQFAEDTFQKLIQRKDRSTGVTNWVVPDERDLRELTNKRAAMAVRNCILHMIPFDVREAAIAEADRTRSAEVKKDPDEAKRSVVLGFDQLNVPSPELEEYLGCKIGQASPDQIKKLKEVYVSVRDGQSVWIDHLSAVRQDRADAAGGGDLEGARPKAKS
jgi:hypothetical protein